MTCCRDYIKQNETKKEFPVHFNGSCLDACFCFYPFVPQSEITFNMEVILNRGPGALHTS